jgi:ribosome maturation factor RimP
MLLTDKVKKIAESLCEEHGLYLVEALVKGDMKNPIFQIYADNEKGITLEQCTLISREMRDELDMDETITGNYRLDVSSPGLTRPLELDFQFKKNIGRDLVVKVNIEDGKKKKYRGKLVSFDADKIEIKTSESMLEIERKNIDQAKVKLAW